ncbi:major facilitator transporter [Striga asiatica]|uniref:Major facilitator transporter n=1 Tax=Striga asiatica TaxID=4170 RepID=A0A5A7PTA4_STRAF|nr:major facilitator transporter [Striga asiatica]
MRLGQHVSFIFVKSAEFTKEPHDFFLFGKWKFRSERHKQARKEPIFTLSSLLPPSQMLSLALFPISFATLFCGPRIGTSMRTLKSSPDGSFTDLFLSSSPSIQTGS